MSIHGAGLDHRLYVLFAVLTHAAIGYAIVAWTTDGPPAAGLAGAVLPDVDLLFAPEWSFPLVHRGLTHTPLFGLAVVGAVAATATLRERRVAERWSEWRTAAPTPGQLGGAVALGDGSHLVVDSLTASGVPWLYPASPNGYGVDLAVHAVEHGVAIWAVLLGLLLVRRWARSGGRTP